MVEPESNPLQEALDVERERKRFKGFGVNKKRRITKDKKVKHGKIGASKRRKSVKHDKRGH